MVGVRARLPAERAVSPVIGAVLLIAIVVALSTLAGVAVFGLAEEQDPAPTAKLELEPIEDSDRYALAHVSGDRIDGDRIRIRGIDDPDTLAGTNLTAGESVRVLPRETTITVVWLDRSGARSSHVLTEFSIDPADVVPAAVVPTFAGGSVFTGRASGLVAVEGDGGSVTAVPNTSDVAAVGGKGADVNGDGTDDVPYVDTGGTVRVVDADGDVTALADSSDIPGSVETDKSRVAVGSWDGSPRSVFFVNQNHDTLYRVAPGGSPQVVATPGNGVQAVSGIGDIDGDGTDELVFADGSQQLRYLEPGGTIQNIDNGQTGSNNGVGAGSLADLDGDGTPSVVAVDGSNDIKINSEPSGGTTTVLTAPDAAKSPPTAADVDGDGALEIVYVGAASNRIKYVDDPLGSPTITYLTDESGSRVDGSDETGVA